MKLRYRLFERKSGIFFIEDRVTGKQESLKTRDPGAAHRIFHAKNEAHQQPAINLQVARAYLMASDPLVAKRTWQHVMEELVKTKHDPTRQRWQTAIKDKAFDPIRSLVLIETHAEHFLRALERGTVSTNVHLPKLHNFCLDMDWLPWPPGPIQKKRAITAAEHRMIITAEPNPERKVFTNSAGISDASCGDIANLRAEDVDWRGFAAPHFTEVHDALPSGTASQGKARCVVVFRQRTWRITIKTGRGRGQLRPFGYGQGLARKNCCGKEFAGKSW